MELPQLDPNINMDDVRGVCWEKDQLIMVLRKRVEQLEKFILEMKEPLPLDVMADKDIEASVGDNHRKGT